MDAERVYVVCASTREGRAWAERNHPRRLGRVVHPDSVAAMRGLALEGQAVYCLDSPSQDARNAWAATGARLVLLA